LSKRTGTGAGQAEFEATSNKMNITITEKRKKLGISVLRNGPPPAMDGDDSRAEAIALAKKEARYDLESSCINIHKLFDHIYKLEWAF
jgi:hypothetical protein